MHRLLSNDIKGLQPGQAKPACLLDRQGKIVFACLAQALPTEVLLAVAPFQLEPARAALAKYVVSEAVELENATDRFRTLSVYGPALKTWTPPAFPAEELFSFTLPLPDPPGRLFLLSAGRAAETWAGLQQAFQSGGLEPGSPEAFELLRIEAGLPAPGKEITGETILNELGREEFVSFTKGCYIGQEIVARIKYRAHPPRLLSGFTLEGTTLPKEGSPVLHQGQEAGIVTSACFSTTLGKPVALGFLKYGIETELQIEGRPARKTSLPFVSGFS